MSNDPLAEALSPSPGVDCDHPRIVDLARELTKGAPGEREAAAALFRHVRDTYRYIPYAPFSAIEDYEGTALLDRGYGFCTQKSALLISLARASGIPARFHFADLRNHNLPGKLGAVLGSDLMIYHTYVELFLGGSWLKATPSFERALCHKMCWRVVDFDGSEDAILHPTDLAGRLHIEYILDRGTLAKVPLPLMLDEWRRIYGPKTLDRWKEAALTVKDLVLS